MGMDALVFAAGAERRRRAVLLILCLGVLMVIVDSTIVGVALPAIREQLRFSDSALVWVVSAYPLPFGGTLLLGGRLGDLYGHRRIFLTGILLFTIASLVCGLATTPARLIAARAVQGLGGAIVVSVTYAFIIETFTDEAECAAALGFYGFVRAAGGILGLMLGGPIVSGLDWHWIFLVNVPVGGAVFAVCMGLMPRAQVAHAGSRLDFPGAVVLTAALFTLIYTILNANSTRASPGSTLSLAATAAVLMAIFARIEARASDPLMPLEIFRRRQLVLIMGVRFLWAAAQAPWGFFTTLYMQVVLGFGPMSVALVFLPANIIVAVISLGFAARLNARFGVTRVVNAGLALGVVGLILFARLPVNGSLLVDVFPPLILLALGSGIASTPLLLLDPKDIPAGGTGVVSGIVNTASLLGNLVGVTILASVAATRTTALVASGTTSSIALTNGYRLAFMVATAWAVAALAVNVIAGARSARPS
jgi:MFS family permease